MAIKSIEPPRTVSWYRNPQRLLALGSAHAQIGPHEYIQIAIEDPVDVSNLGLGAMILDQPVGLQYIGSNLRAKVDVELGILDLLGRGPLLLHLMLVQL